MSKREPQSEVADLFRELKGQVEYLQELGVDALAAELPEIKPGPTAADLPDSARADSGIPVERLEKFIPQEDILKKTEKKRPAVKEDTEKRRRRKRLLESTRLSRLPKLSKRDPAAAATRLFQQNKKQTGEDQMTQEPNLTETLFGDISETLPEADQTIEEIREFIGDCTRCPLHEGRTNIVHSTGNREADLMFVGEAPGADEDAQGEPFVGRAGKLLNKIIESIGLKREEVFIGNINRCRPPGNRQPTTEEAETCKPFLIKEISVVRPKVIVVLGNTAMKNLLETKQGITKMRGQFVDYYGVKVMPTFHPAYLLRDPRKKREVWEDMKKVRDELNRTG